MLCNLASGRKYEYILHNALSDFNIIYISE